MISQKILHKPLLSWKTRMDTRGRQGHPLLRGGRRREKAGYSHGLSSSQMQSLSSMCEAFIPSIPMEKLHHLTDGGGGGKQQHPPSKSLEAFLLACGSDSPVPDEVRRFFLYLFNSFLSAASSNSCCLLHHVVAPSSSNVLITHISCLVRNLAVPCQFGFMMYLKSSICDFFLLFGRLRNS